MTSRRTWVLVSFAVLVIAGTFSSAMIGQIDVGARDVVGSLLHHIGIDTDWRPDDDFLDRTLWYLRFPRVAMSLLVGAALAVAGVVMQAIFGNPLAEPGVVGVSAGAALGAAIAIATGVSLAGGWTIAAMAFLGGLMATLFVYGMARSAGRTEVVTLLLTGIAVNAVAGAGLAFVMFAGDTSSREQIVFWQLGSMNGSRWSEVAVVFTVALPATIAAMAMARRFDLLSLGERTAVHLGMRVELLRIASIILVTLLAAVAVAFVGIIAFVGLVIPHLVRMLIGPSHGYLIVTSAIGGAALLVWSDLLARTIVSGADMPIGMLTSLVGGPFFFYLIRRTRARSGGWA